MSTGKSTWPQQPVKSNLAVWEQVVWTHTKLVCSLVVGVFGKIFLLTFFSFGPCFAIKCTASTVLICSLQSEVKLWAVLYWLGCGICFAYGSFCVKSDSFLFTFMILFKLCLTVWHQKIFLLIFVNCIVFFSPGNFVVFTPIRNITSRDMTCCRGTDNTMYNRSRLACHTVCHNGKYGEPRLHFVAFYFLSFWFDTQLPKYVCQCLPLCTPEPLLLVFISSVGCVLSPNWLPCHSLPQVLVVGQDLVGWGLGGLLLPSPLPVSPQEAVWVQVHNTVYPLHTPPPKITVQLEPE